MRIFLVGKNRAIKVKSAVIIECVQHAARNTAIMGACPLNGYYATVTALRTKLAGCSMPYCSLTFKSLDYFVLLRSAMGFCRYALQ